MDIISIKLRGLLVRMLIIGIAAALLVFVALVLGRYAASLEQGAARLQAARTAGERIDRSAQNMQANTALLVSMLPAAPVSTESLLMLRLDDIKARFGSAEISVTMIEQKGDELQIPVTITDTLHDYSRFVNNLTFLGSLRLPAFTTISVAVERADAKSKGAPKITIHGLLRVPNALPRMYQQGGQPQ